MNSIILCEGRTDAILLSYYLERVYGWKHSKKIPKPYTKIEISKNQEANWYKKDDDYLIIFGVGGKDNFKNVIDMYLSQVLLNYSREDSFAKLVIMADKDDLSVHDIEQKHIEWLAPFVSEIKDREWKENIYIDEFENEQTVKALSIIIPTDKQGALESTLLDSLSENVYDKNIVNKCQKFISGIRSETIKYISSDRLALKAHLSSVFAVMSPEKVFSTLDVVIKNTPWEKSETLKECFQILGEL